LPEKQIQGFGTGAAPRSRTTKNSEHFVILALDATFDGSGAAGSFVPAVQVLSDSGEEVFLCPLAGVLQAGESATVTFAPFLRDNVGLTGVFYDFANSGDWLDIRTTGTGPTGQGVFFASANRFTLENDGGDFNIVDAGTGLDLVSNFGNITLDASTANVQVNAPSGFVQLQGGPAGVLVVQSDGVVMSENVLVTLEVGKTLEVQDHLGSPIFRVNENGDLQGKTGKALTFNL